MDKKFLFSGINISSKLDFLLKKYLLLIKHKIIPFEITKSKIMIFGRDYYYESTLGLVAYQVSLIHHLNLIRKLPIKNSKPVLFDIGANVGCFSLVFKDVFPKATVFAFEPVPQVYECLKNNLTGCSNVTLENQGLSNKQGYCRFEYNLENPDMSKISENGDITVHITTIDDYCKLNNVSHIDFLKIDTETFEKNVLLGGVNSLSLTKYLLLEINFEKGNKNYTVPELMGLLNSDLYNFQLLEIINFLDKNVAATQVLDFLFINNKYTNE